MSSLWARLTSGLRRMLNAVLRRKRPALIEEPQPEATSTPAAVEPTQTAVPYAPLPVLPPWATKSAELRRYERARLAHDKFVTPQGERPPPQEKIARPPRIKPEPTPPAVETSAVKDDEMFIVDEYKEGDGQGDVLYKQTEFYGEFNFRDSILDQLDRYWVYLRRMRKHSPATYYLCKEIGATLVPYVATFSNRKHSMTRFQDEDIDEYRSLIKLPPYFKQHWPGFGCFVIGANPMDEAEELASEGKHPQNKILYVVKFAALTKLTKPPWYVQPKSGGHVYEVLLWWDRPHDPKSRLNRFQGYPKLHYVWINEAGDRIQALRTRLKSNGSYRSAGCWGLNEDVDKEDRARGFTPQLLICRSFCDFARMFEHSSFSMVRVQVDKDGMAATFGINPQRLAYFFQDRDIKVSADGCHVQRIFHVVRPHVRADGTAVKMHFRGLRKFKWAGYDVKITVPALDHFMLPEWGLAVQIEPRKSKLRKGWMEAEELAAKMRKYIEMGIGKTRH